MNKPNNLKPIVPLITMLSIGNAVACENHDMFTNRFGNFSLNANHQVSADFVAAPSIKLQYPFFNSIEINERKTIQLKYDATEKFSMISMKISAPETVNLKSNADFILEQKKGSVEMELLANTIGRHVVNIQVNALLDGEPYVLTKKLYINAKQAS